MKKIFILLLSFGYLSIFSQSKVIVRNSGDQSPISNATVSCNSKIIGKTDGSGISVFKTKCKKVEISARGFQNDDVVVDKVMEVFLMKADPNVENIQAIVLEDKSDPRALEILRKVNENYNENSPKSLESYAFKSYEKISLDFDEDSIKAYNAYIANRIDSLKKIPQLPMKATKKKDSLESVNLMKLVGGSKIFLWERASQNLYSKKYGEKINILDNKVAGLKEPIYELMAFRSNRNQIPKEVREENRNLYRFFLTDSIEIEGRENYVIRFRQVDYKQSPKQKKFNGYLYVDKASYALKKIESNSKIKSEGSITSIWKPIENKWFLVKENYKLKMGSASFDTDDKKDKKRTKEEKDSEKKHIKKFGSYAFVTADYFDFKTSIEEKPEDFKGYTISVKNSDGNEIDQYRTENLTDREQATYTKIDSLSAKYKLSQKAKALTGLLKGKVRLGMLDFDLSKVIGYNKYEHIRLGAGVKLNEKFNRYISPDAYFAYGIYDKDFKYGVGVDVRTTLEKNSFFRAEYFDDVMAAGRFSENLWNFRMKIMNSGVALNNNVFFGYKGFKVSYENDFTNALTINIATKRTQEESKFNYNFKELGSRFDIASSTITLKYSPNSKNIMTPTGKYTYEQNLPEFYLNYEQGYKALGGDLQFSRFDALFVQNFKTKLGLTGVRLYGGLVTGDAPIWKNFTLNGLGNGNGGLNFNLTSYLGFATMEGGKYYNDKFLGAYLTHRLPWYFKSFGKNVSSFDVIYRGTIGDMKNPEFHQFDFKKLDHLYNELGLEWNNFLSSQFNLGFFYRVGYYNTPKFKDNFAIQFKLKLLGF
ncbi:hypothetical protein EG346_20030 [Chryseobacterium carnipullorum]|uniref:Carboxypeptidase-like regulatory domain-containing protein n=2 Tax=Chryseobacterium carnipullorum TaxID=1124835 RepID=A0A3G6MA38_CHRCU|nr:hypothetical protein [Chryseobacterium carnipullorum]AZA50325.1 hypothetical protein EG346_20030 [Chryseobacterium carnipullorum]AZA65198.1 hypothetical protein EG345_11085 [Chryseobacterium carnipullorum]